MNNEVNNQNNQTNQESPEVKMELALFDLRVAWANAYEASKNHYGQNNSEINDLYYEIIDSISKLERTLYTESISPENALYKYTASRYNESAEAVAVEIPQLAEAVA